MRPLTWVLERRSTPSRNMQDRFKSVAVCGGKNGRNNLNHSARIVHSEPFANPYLCPCTSKFSLPHAPTHFLESDNLPNFSQTYGPSVSFQRDKRPRLRRSFPLPIACRAGSPQGLPKTNSSDQIWMNLQTNYDLWHEEYAERKAIKNIKPLKRAA